MTPVPTPVRTGVPTPVRTTVGTPVPTVVRTPVLNARVRVRVRVPARARLLHLAPSAWPLATGNPHDSVEIIIMKAPTRASSPAAVGARPADRHAAMMMIPSGTEFPTKPTAGGTR